MKRNFLIFLINIFVIVFGYATASAQSYDKMWLRVDSLSKLDRPKSIISEAQKILAKAKKEKNFPQQLKAQILITEKQCDLDPELFLPDEYEKLIETLSPSLSLKGKGDQQYSLSDDNAGHLAILHCMLASAYNEMQYSGTHDFDEETREQFPAKAKEHCNAALADMQTLSHINNKDYEPLITQQEDSRFFNHDLLNALLNNILNNWSYKFSEEEKVGIYNKAIAVYDANGNRNASTLLRLKVLGIQHSTNTKSIKISDIKYQSVLDSLHSQTQDIETGADVDIALINTYNDNDKKVAFARQCIDHWADSKRLNEFKNIEAKLMSSHIFIKTQYDVLSNKPFALNFKYRNATNATLTIHEYAGRDKKGSLVETGKVIDTRKYTITLDESNQQRKTNNLPFESETTDSLTLPAGHYIFVAETKGAKSIREVTITSLRVVSFYLPDNKNILVTVLDNETGRPVPNATIMCFKNFNHNNHYGQAPDKKFVTDNKGEVTIPHYDSNTNTEFSYIVAVRDASKYGTPQEDVSNGNYVWRTAGYGSDDKETMHMESFLDRSIFRPGQTVNANAVVYRQKGDDVEVAPGQMVQATVMDPDYKEILTDSAKTNEFGSADFSFKLPENSKLGYYQIRFIFNGKDRHTDIFEVEEYKRPTFDVQFAAEKNTAKFSLDDRARVYGQAKTYSDVPVQNATVHYTISWKERYRFWRNSTHQLLEDNTKTDASGNFIIDFPTTLQEEVYCDSIRFTIKTEVTDANGEMESAEYSFNAKNPNYKKDSTKDVEKPKDELTVSTNEISESQDAVVTFKAIEKDALVYYYVLSNNKIESKGTKVLNDGELKFTVKYKKEWGDGVSVLVFYVRNGHLCLKEKSLAYIRPDKALKLSWNTFRDKLQPGQKEEWTLTVRDHNNSIVNGAELCAVMYDASLDAIRKHNWDFKLNFKRNINSIRSKSSAGNSNYQFYLSPKSKTFTTSSRLYDILQEFEHQRYYKTRSDGGIRIRGSKQLLMAQAAAPNQALVGSIAGLEDADGIVVDEEPAEVYNHLNEVAVNVKKTPSTAAKTLRTNLTELAFFYPHLTTDSKGEAHIAFTLPDCLTEWKFMGFAHTKDMDYGLITAQAVAKKDFMVQPNMPRFLREGDKAIITTKVINMTDKAVKGTATLRILDAKTEQVICTKEASYNISASQSTAVSFPIDANIKEGDYICDITATDGKSSDGERNRLPILSTKVDVVENVPFYLDGPDTKDVDLSALYNNDSKTATDKNIKVTYTDNPALPVFNSLKALQNPKHENAPCYAASLYSNLVLLDMSKVLGSHITDFNPDSAQATATEALTKLQELQLSDGSWSWFKGMDGSRYITLSVAENISRLQSYFTRHGKDVPNSDITKMLKKALKYLDKKELEDYNYRKSHKLSLRPYDDDLRYLYIATNPNKEMLNKYLDEYVEDFKNLTIFGRSQGVLILNKYNRESSARKFLESVMEYTMYKDGFGRYFATDLAYYSWMDYRIPTQLAAMRAIMTLSPKTLSPSLPLYGEGDLQSSHPDGSPHRGGDVEERDREGLFLLDMQLWLLRQKQTQTWDNPLNALDIADFLLTNSKEESLHEPTVPGLVLDGNAVKADSIYNVEMASVLTVTKTSPAVSWGNVRSTFKEELTNLKQYTSGELTISRKVIRDGNKLTIRLILHADRDMDFVQVVSQHAASLEPLNIHSGYQWLGGRGCYLEMHDDRATLFFDKFTRGTTTIDLDYYIAHDGDYHSGYASIECTYAPEFGAHTSGNDISFSK